MIGEVTACLPLSPALADHRTTPLSSLAGGSPNTIQLDEVSTRGLPLIAHLVTTEALLQAKEFTTLLEAEGYRKQSFGQRGGCRPNSVPTASAVAKGGASAIVGFASTGAADIGFGKRRGGRIDGSDFA